jgi:hypothetical protein
MISLLPGGAEVVWRCGGDSKGMGHLDRRGERPVGKMKESWGWLFEEKKGARLHLKIEGIKPNL